MVKRHSTKALVSGKGKGRGVTSLGPLGGRLFATPPSNRREGRGMGGRGKKSEASSEGSSAEATKISMGPSPPKQRPQTREESDNLQRALEAEMAIFLREQNAQLLEEVERLKKGQQCPHRSGPTSTPSS